MARQRLMQRLARWHIWIGWLAGFPFLLWTATGLWMVARPIEEVRGDSLQASPPAIETAALTLPRLPAAIQSALLVQQPNGPVWVVTELDGARYRYSTRDGSVVPPVLQQEARRIAEDAYAGRAGIESLKYFPADIAPLELRRNVPSWRVSFSDGTNIYIDNTTGEVLALRTSQWRLYDLMWGLHIMDLETREDTHHPILIGFAGLSVLGTLLGCVLLFRRRKRRVRALRATAGE